MPPNSPVAPEHALTFEILIAGSALPDHFMVASVVVESEINRAGIAKFEFLGDRPEDDEQSIAISLSQKANQDVSFKVNGKLIFTGTINRLRAQHGGTHGTRLILEARDTMAKLQGPPMSAAWETVSDSDVVSKVCEEAGVTYAGDSTTVVYEQVVQSNQTALDFILTRSERAGCYLTADAGTIYWKRLALAPPAAYLVTLHESLYGFSRHAVVPRWKSVQVQSWSVEEKAPLHAVAAASGVVGASDTLIVNRQCSSQSDVAALATAHAIRLSLAAQEGYGYTIGAPDLKVGGGVEVKGTGVFDGKYFVSKVVHTIADGTFNTEFATGLSPEQLDTFLRPPSQGPVIGQVQNLKDPLKLGRVKVTAPGLLGERTALAWAPLVSPLGKGTLWMPDIGDQVMVAFQDNDISAPMVVGTIWSVPDQPPLTAEKYNGDTGARTRVIGSHGGPSIVLHQGDSAGIELLSADGSDKLMLGDVAGGVSLTTGHKLLIDAKPVQITAVSGALAIAASEATVKVDTTVAINGLAITLDAKGKISIDGSGGINLNKGALEVI